jgi:hypothetical protein
LLAAAEIDRLLYFTCLVVVKLFLSQFQQLPSIYAIIPGLHAVREIDNYSRLLSIKSRRLMGKRDFLIREQYA